MSGPVLTPADPSAPLDGIVVVALEQAIASPLATRNLADLGATVVKIERPDGGDLARHYDTDVGGQSAFFVWANRGKHSLVLDLKEPADRSRFDRLVAGADVFIENLSPAAAERLGVLSRQLHERHPHLIACDISGYGLDGPRTDDKAYDLAIQAEAGAMALTGGPETMSKVGFSVADIAAAMYALTSILAALTRRERTGQGAAISVSMLDCLAEWTAPLVYAAAHTGRERERAEHRHSAIAPYGLYELADGASVLVAVQAPREWAAFAETVLARPELADDPRFATNADRIANVAELESEIDAVFRSEPPAEIVARLIEGGIAHGRARGPIEVWEHEQLAARGRFHPVSTPTGEATVYRPPLDIDGLPAPRPWIPALGAHDPAVVELLEARAASRATGPDGDQ